MYRILALISTPALLPTQKDGYEITLCQDAETEAGLLMQKYDGLILNLFLPGRDGLTLLEQMHDQLPPVVLVLTRLLTPYIIQSAESLCGGYILRIPCSDREIAHRLEDMLQKFDSPAPDVSTVFARYHLQRLNLSAGKGFYRMMEILPGFNPKRDPCLFSDFYPSLGQREILLLSRRLTTPSTVPSSRPMTRETKLSGRSIFRIPPNAQKIKHFFLLLQHG